MGAEVSVAVRPEVAARVPAVDRRALESSIVRALPFLPRPAVRVHLEVVDDAAMDRLHRERSGIAGTTDVLTFPAHGETGPIDVDIVACADEAARRAAEFGHAVDRELLLYALHGLLHCCGHDDHEPAAHDRMHAEEDRILRALGVGATFRPEGPR
jgi:probable rRNA maturation factor